MIESIIKWSIHNRILVLLVAAIIGAWGVQSLRNTPLDALPDLSDVQVIIKTSYPGQAPQVVEDQVTYPLTTAMLSIPKAVNVRGYSFFGDSYVYVIFEDDTDLYWARSRVLEYLSQVSSQLPEQAKANLGPDATGVGWIYEYALRDKTGKHDLAELRSLQDWFLKFELQALSGVAEVATIGGMVKQYQVQVKPESLRAYQLTLATIKQAIQRGNSEAGASVIEMAEAEYMVRSTGYIKGIEDLKKIPLMVTENGIAVVLSDVADISLGPQMRRGISELDGEGEVVGGVIIMRSGENALEVIKDVKSKLATLTASLPDGVELVTTYDRSLLIKRAVTTLGEKIVEESLIVILICAIFLFHFRSSLVIILSLPLGILMAFIVMEKIGITANMMSLGGIAIAIGAMVDASIVMVENVHKHLEHEQVNRENRWQIISKASCEVAPTLFFSLLIITLSFLPIFTLQAQEGRLFTPLAYTKTFTMAAAALLSITLVPVLMGFFIRGRITAEAKNPLNRALVKIYQPLMSVLIRRPKTVVFSSLIILLIGLYPVTQLGTEFMPEIDEGDLLYMPNTLPSISIGKAQELLQQTNKIIKTLPEVKTVFGKIGRAETATDPAPLTMIETTIQFIPQSQWREGMTIEKIKQELDVMLDIPGITNTWVMPIKNRIDMLVTGIKTPLGIKVAGSDLEQIQHVGQQIEGLLKTLPSTKSVYSERVASARYVVIDIDRTSAARFGLNIMDIQDYITAAIGGMQIATTVEGLERYSINIRYPRALRDSVYKIQQLPIITPRGAHIPLSEVANIRIEEGPGIIKTENARLNGWVYIDINDSDVGQYVRKANQLIQQQIDLPAGYSLSWSGQYEYMQRAITKLTTVLPLTLAVIILLLYLNLRNFVEVSIILLTLPLSLLGGLWLLYLLDFNLSVAVVVGFIALAGLAIEIGVVMLFYLNKALNQQLEIAENESRPIAIENIKQAVINGSLKRIRPIVMTVSVVILAILPIMLGSGTGSEIMRRIAAPMVGGMLSTLFFSTLVLPAIFLIWKQRLLIPKAVE